MKTLTPENFGEKAQVPSPPPSPPARPPTAEPKSSHPLRFHRSSLAWCGCGVHAALLTAAIPVDNPPTAAVRKPTNGCRCCDHVCLLSRRSSVSVSSPLRLLLLFRWQLQLRRPYAPGQTVQYSQRGCWQLPSLLYASPDPAPACANPCRHGETSMPLSESSGVLAYSYNPYGKSLLQL